ncbi:MAG TPA: hypothetical protein PLT51_00840 [Candidatus Dojkabacteria bacterium]|jgi:hypothetical protein|nr:hypothetical protein [Candidatus Dojkabacteria bacterium]
MDTTTVLQIIKMIDNRIETLNTTCEMYVSMRTETDGAISALIELRDHLQEYIEQSLSAMEQSTPE